MRITEAFARYGATLKNVNWSVSAENGKGELVLSLWKHFFQGPNKGVLRYIDRVSRWQGHGNKEFRANIDKAFKKEQVIRAVISRTDDEAAVIRGEDASKLKNTFYVKEDWIGTLEVWDGDNFEIVFSAKDT